MPRHEFVTPETIYGTILFCAILAAADDVDDDVHLLLQGMVASLAIWFAHVVAVTVARHGSRDGEDVGAREALRHALHHSAGILIGPVLPIAVLALGAVGVIDDLSGYFLALATGVGMLAVFGLISCIERRAPWYLCVGGALLAGGAGLVAITLKAVFE